LISREWIPFLLDYATSVYSIRFLESLFLWTLKFSSLYPFHPTWATVPYRPRRNPLIFVSSCILFLGLRNGFFECGRFRGLAVLLFFSMSFAYKTGCLFTLPPSPPSGRAFFSTFFIPLVRFSAFPFTRCTFLSTAITIRFSPFR